LGEIKRIISVEKMNYRNETFSQFLRKKKLPQFYSRSTNFMAIVMVIIVIIATHKIGIGVTIFFSLFFLTFLTIVKLVMYSNSYGLYKKGREIFDCFDENDRILLEKVNVFIKRFDKYSIKSRSSLMGGAFLWDFNYADLIIVDTSLILIGYNDYFGGNQYFKPVEISPGDSKSGLPQKKLTALEFRKGKYELELEDPFYNRNIILEIDDESEGLKQWLTICKQTLR
jgi:hypothetical protein